MDRNIHLFGGPGNILQLRDADHGQDGRQYQYGGKSQSKARADFHIREKHGESKIKVLIGVVELDATICCYRPNTHAIAGSETRLSSSLDISLSMSTRISMRSSIVPSPTK